MEILQESTASHTFGKTGLISAGLGTKKGAAVGQASAPPGRGVQHPHGVSNVQGW